MFSYVSELLIPIALGAVAWVQWRVSEKREIAQILAAEHAETQQRDEALTNWGFRVISLMAELETLCHPITKERPHNYNEISELLSWKASALVDQGRLFFPNVDINQEPDGYRVKLLDQVLKCCYVARYLATQSAHDNGEVLRRHVAYSRVNFIRLLQKETKQTLRKVSKEHAGSYVSQDVALWPVPESTDRLPN